MGHVSDSSETSSSVLDITSEQSNALLDRPSLHVIEVNEEDNYNEAHVSGAHCLEYDVITTAVLYCDRNDDLVCYCWSVECPVAGSATETASALGCTEVYCKQAGISSWQDAGFQTAP